MYYYIIRTFVSNILYIVIMYYTNVKPTFVYVK